MLLPYAPSGTAVSATVFVEPAAVQYFLAAGFALMARRTDVARFASVPPPTLYCPSSGFSVFAATHVSVTSPYGPEMMSLSPTVELAAVQVKLEDAATLVSDPATAVIPTPPPP